MSGFSYEQLLNCTDECDYLRNFMADTPRVGDFELAPSPLQQPQSQQQPQPQQEQPQPPDFAQQLLDAIFTSEQLAGFNEDAGHAAAYVPASRPVAPVDPAEVCARFGLPVVVVQAY